MCSKQALHEPPGLAGASETRMSPDQTKPSVKLAEVDPNLAESSSNPAATREFRTLAATACPAPPHALTSHWEPKCGQHLPEPG